MSGVVDSPEDDLRDILMLYDVEERRARRQQKKQIIDLVASIGGDARAYRRERARKSRAIVAEFYMPPEDLSSGLRLAQLRHRTWPRP
jgi:hypothetical protein